MGLRIIPDLIGRLGRGGMSVVGGGAFDESSIPGLVLNLDARELSSDGSAVASWADVSPYAHVAAQATGSKQPTFRATGLNGLPAVQFDGGDELVISSAASLNLKADFTIIAVWQTSSVAITQRLISKATQYAHYADLKFQTFSNLGVKNYAGGQFIIANRALIFSSTFKSDYNVQFALYGADTSLVTGGAVDIGDGSGAAVYIGSGNGGSYLTGHLSQLLVYKPAPTSAQLAQLYRLLGSRWATGYCVTVGNATAPNADEPLTIPTYDGSGQSVHPDVVKVVGGWNGYEYWMAMTPYPAADNTKENPSILASSDGTTWVVPDGLTNPIEPFPGAGTHNADACLVHAQDNKLYCYWMYSDDGTTAEKMFVRSSVDGVTWSDKSELLSSATKELQSPSVIWDGTQYVMWHVDNTTGTSIVYRRTCATPDGAWSAPTACTIVNNPGGTVVGHIHVTLHNGTYFALTMGSNGNIATSPDGLWWFFKPAAFMTGAVGNWDATGIYRSCMIPLTDTTFDLWYSARAGAPAVWGIGRTTLTL